MKKIKFLFSLIILIHFSTQLISQDIRSSTQGLSIGISGMYGTWSSDSFFLGDLDDLEPNGYGYSIRAAYGINQNIEGFMSYSSTGYSREFDWDTYKLTNIVIGGRFNFGATLRPVRPFLEAGMGFNGLTIDPITFDGISTFKLRSNGIGVILGGGVHFFVKKYLSINASGRFSIGSFSSSSLSGTEVTNIEESLDFSITTIHIGVTYFIE